jgi:hypothetical protein
MTNHLGRGKKAWLDPRREAILCHFERPFRAWKRCADTPDLGLHGQSPLDRWTGQCQQRRALQQTWPMLTTNMDYWSKKRSSRLNTCTNSWAWQSKNASTVETPTIFHNANNLSSNDMDTKSKKFFIETMPTTKNCFFFFFNIYNPACCYNAHCITEEKLLPREG